MESILLIIVPAVLVFGYFVTGRFGKFIDENLKVPESSCGRHRKVYIAETYGKSAYTVSKEISAILESLPEDDGSDILICKKADPRIISCLEETGCIIETDLLQ